LPLKFRLLHYVTVPTVHMIPQILVLIQHHSSVSVSEVFFDSSFESEKITVGVQMAKTFQVGTHVSDKQMYFSDYEIRLAVGEVSRILQNSSTFAHGVP
jgi:hypothetical protein